METVTLREVAGPPETDSASSLVWGYHEWNTALLSYFFRPREPDGLGAVTRLEVTPEALLDATKRRCAGPDVALHSLREMFEREHSNRTFAAALGEDDWSPGSFSAPTFIVHLVVSCLVASEGEGGDAYLERLKQWCPAGVGNTRILAQRWEELGGWLAARVADGDLYRELVLPDRRKGWQNIGYSLDLAFPPRADLLRLQKLLKEEGLVGSDPTPSEIVRAVGNHLHRFGETFQEVYREFQTAFTNGEARWNHVFLLTARAICKAEQVNVDGQQGVELHASMDLSGVIPFLTGISEESIKALGMRGVEYDTIEGGKRWAGAVASETQDDFIGPVRDLLAGGMEAGSLARGVTSGLLCFEPLAGGVFTATGPTLSDECQFLFVRADKKDALLERVVGSRSGQQPQEGGSPAEGWLLVRDFTLKNVGDTADPLALLPPRLRLASATGFRVADGWIGASAVHPEVEAIGATSVRAIHETWNEDLAAGTIPGRWMLPSRPLEGLVTLLATFENPEQTLRESVRFYSSAAHSLFKSPTQSQLGKSFLEGSRNDTLAPTNSPGCRAAEEDLLSDLMDVIYLGPSIGQVSIDSPRGFSWRVVRDQGEPRLEYIGGEKGLEPRRSWVPSKLLRRLWRMAFSPAMTIGNLSEVPQELLHAYRSAVTWKNGLITLDWNVSIQRKEVDEGQSVSPVPPHEAMDQLVEAVAAACGATAGIDEATLIELFGRFFVGFDAPRALLWDIARGWVEAGCLEQLLPWKWGGPRYFANRPHFSVYQAGDEQRAAVAGLVTKADRNALQDAVARLSGVHLRMRGSISPFVPGVPLLTGVDGSTLDGLEKLLDFGQRATVPRLGDQLASITDVARVPRVNAGTYSYVQTWSWDRGFFLDGDRRSGGVHLLRHRGPGQPDHYEIHDGERVVWATVARAWAFLFAHLHANRPAFEESGLVLSRQRFSGAHLPLAVGRYLAALGPVSAGPVLDDHDRVYSYAFPTTGLLRWTSNRLTKRPT